MKHSRKHVAPVWSIVAAVCFLALCGCHQLPSVASQKDTVVKFKLAPLKEKKETIEEWHDSITLAKITASDTHCCFLRFQYAMKNLAYFLRESEYKKHDKIRYRKIVEEFMLIAKKSTNLSFMTECLEDRSNAEAEITKVKMAAISSLVSLEDSELFPDLLKMFSDTAYDFPVQCVIADGLIKYLPDNKTLDNRAAITVRAMTLKWHYPGTEMKEVEHLIGMSIDFPVLNEALRLSKSNTPVSERTIELNLNYWRKLLAQGGDLFGNSSLENIAILKSLALPAASQKIDTLIYYTLCEVVPTESLAVFNARMESEESFENLKTMLSFYYSLKKSGVSLDSQFAKATKAGQTMEKTRALAQKFITGRFTALPIATQKQAYELYALNFSDQAHAFLCDRFKKGNESAAFYETAVNAGLWMISKRLFNPQKVQDLKNAMDKLLFSGRNRSDYKQIFEFVYANNRTYYNQWLEMRNAVTQGNIRIKGDFVDCLVKVITKIESFSKLKADERKKFTVRNLEMFEKLFASQDTAAILKMVPYLEKKKQIDFLLADYFLYTFEKGKKHASVAHVILAGDLSSRYIKNLRKNPDLYKAYLKLFAQGVASKDNDMSLLCADYFFRIIGTADADLEDHVRAEFNSRWPNLRNISRK